MELQDGYRVTPDHSGVLRDNESRGRCGHTVVHGHAQAIRSTRFRTSTARRAMARAAWARVAVGLLGPTPARMPLYDATGWSTLEDWEIYANDHSAQFHSRRPDPVRVPGLQPDPGGSALVSPPLCVHPPQHPRRPEATATRFPTSPSWRTRPGSPRPLRHLAWTGGLPLRRHDPVAGGFSEASSKGFSHAPPSWRMAETL